MASTNFKLFDENKVNMMSDAEYNIASQRLNGVQTGIASSQLQNKTLYQTSLMSYALAQLMNANGIDANDTAAVSAFVSGLSNSIVQKVLDKATEDMAISGTDNSHYMTPALVKKEIGSLDLLGNWNYCCHVDSTTEPAEFTTINPVKLFSINEILVKINSGTIPKTYTGGTGSALALSFISENSYKFGANFYPGIASDYFRKTNVEDVKIIFKRLVITGGRDSGSSNYKIFYSQNQYSGTENPPYSSTSIESPNVDQNPVLTGAKCHAVSGFSSIDADIYYR